MTSTELTLLIHPTSVESAFSSQLSCRVSREGTCLTLEHRYSYSKKAPALEYEAQRNKLSTPHFHGELWKKTCFEFFIRDSLSGHYWEWNFIPSQDWGAFSFCGERLRVFKKDQLLEAAPRGVESQQEETETQKILSVKTNLDLGFSSLLRWQLLSNSTSRLEFSCNAVIKHQGVDAHYWSSQHASPLKADFHAKAGFLPFSF